MDDTAAPPRRRRRKTAEKPDKAAEPGDQAAEPDPEPVAAAHVVATAPEAAPQAPVIFREPPQAVCGWCCTRLPLSELAETGGGLVCSDQAGCDRRMRERGLLPVDESQAHTAQFAGGSVSSWY